MDNENYILTNEQKQSLTRIKDSIVSGQENVDVSLIHLIQDVAGLKGKDGRSKEGRAVKSFLSEIDLNAIPASEYQKVDKPELTEEHEEFIRNNRGTMKYVEMSRILFGNESLTSLSAEVRMVTQYCKNLVGEDFEEGQAEHGVAFQYKPPKHLNII